MKSAVLKEFRQIPGVGKAISEDFYNIGLRSIADFQNADPDAIYEKICEYQKMKVDRCMLYVCRLAVYYASHSKHDPELLKWWNWKDRA